MKWLFLGIALPLAACASGPVGMDPELQVVQGNVLPEPSRDDLVIRSQPYTVGPYDKLTIDVFGVESLKTEVQTDASGGFSFPLVGRVEASGHTPAEIEQDIEQRLVRYVREPQVSVNLTDIQSQVVTVEGEVKEPGLYPVIGNMSLLRAVARAGGVGDLADLNQVVVFREVSGQRYAALYDLRAIRRGNYADPEIYANDVVVVGDSSARRLFRDLLAVAPVLTSPLVILLTN